MAELVILEQPVSIFHFRYKSEMNGTHGHIHGRNSVKDSLPTVELRNCPIQEAIIRCTLATVDADTRQHPHRLVYKNKRLLEPEPHDVLVNDENKWTAYFKLGIHKTTKTNVKKLLEEKYERVKKEENCGRDLTSKQKVDIEKISKQESKQVNLSSVRLRFEALNQQGRPIFNLQGNPLVVFSEPIGDKKCANQEELGISKSSCSAGSCLGGDEVMLFVNKVDKTKIRVRFFEEDAAGEEIWHAFGNFSQKDVWFQYGISFQTPPYMHQFITEDTNVFYQLERTTDGERSPPMPFTYWPCYNKRLKMEDRPVEVLQPSSVESLDMQVTSSGTQNDVIQIQYLNLDESGNSPSIQTSALSPEEASNQYLEEELPSVLVPSTETLENPSDLDLLSEYILEEGFDWLDVLNEQPKQSIQEVAQDGPASKRKLKLPSKASLQKLVWAAVSHGDLETLSQILNKVKQTDAKKLLESTNNQGMAAIHLAAKGGYKNLLQSLLDWGVDAGTSDKCSGRLAIHYAVQGGYEEVATLLVQEAASTVDDADLQGQTALFYAAAAGNLKLCDMLLSADADPESSDLRGVTPLHLVAESPQLKELFDPYVEDLDEKLAKLIL